MSKETALIFGYNNYAVEIEANLRIRYDTIQMYSLNKEDTQNTQKNIALFDLSDEWSDIEQELDVKNSIVFCALEDSAENVFLTISLRAHFQDITIIAIASNKESAKKLSMAGANKVIPLVETTAEIIANVLEHPISNKVLNSILYEESLLKIEQVKVSVAENFANIPIANIDWSRYQGIIILSVMHEDMSHNFIYAAKLQDKMIQNGDILVVVGYETDIEAFKKSIGSV